MSAHALRRQADVVRLQELAAQAGGRVVLLDVAARPGRPIRIRFGCRTAGADRDPTEGHPHVHLRIDLPARYPFERPVLTIGTPIFHPNVFASGVVCQGERWLPGDAIDIVLRRIVRLVTFDPTHVNPGSAANRIAASWYLAQRRQTPDAFPTDLPLPAEDGAGRMVRNCPACGIGLRLPRGRQGVVACPSCRHEFRTST